MKRQTNVCESNYQLMSCKYTILEKRQWLQPKDLADHIRQQLRQQGKKGQRLT